MVKASGLPSHAGVTGHAIGGESCLHVVGVNGGVEVLKVTRNTIGRCVAVALFVARKTVINGVSPSQWELGLIVIKGGGLPGHTGVTTLAIGGEAIDQVVWIDRCVVVLLVARHTIGGRIVIALFVTAQTIVDSVSPGKRELCLGLV